jgi:hypothetical protein
MRRERQRIIAPGFPDATDVWRVGFYSGFICPSTASLNKTIVKRSLTAHDRFVICESETKHDKTVILKSLFFHLRLPECPCKSTRLHL